MLTISSNPNGLVPQSNRGYSLVVSVKSWRSGTNKGRTESTRPCKNRPSFVGVSAANSSSHTCCQWPRSGWRFGVCIEVWLRSGRLEINSKLRATKSHIEYIPQSGLSLHQQWGTMAISAVGDITTLQAFTFRWRKRLAGRALVSLMRAVGVCTM